MGSTSEVILSRVRRMQRRQTSLATIIDIKEIVEWPDNRIVITVLRTRRFFLNLTATLESSQKAITDIALSIISTCTLDKDFATEAVKEYILMTRLQNLWILYQEDDNVKAKIFEIIGNVFQHNISYVGQVVVFEMLALNLLKNYPTEQVSEAALGMALRYLRLLDDSRNAYAAKVVSSFFLQVILKTEVNEDILQQTVELLQIYSQQGIRSSFSLTIPEERILYLCNTMGSFVQRFPRILSNVLKGHRLKSPPRLPDICDWIIRKIEDLNIEDSKDEYVAHITCLCFLFLKACEDRHEKLRPQLINVLKFIENPSYADVECFILIVMTFNKHCVFEATFEHDLVGYDLIEALTEKLKWVSGKGSLELDFDHEQDNKYFMEIPQRPHASGTCCDLDPRSREAYLLSAPSTDVNEEMNTEARSERASLEGDMEKMKEMLLREILDLFHMYVCFRSGMPELVSEQLIIAMLNSSVHFGCTELYCTEIFNVEHLIYLMDSTVIEKIYDAHHQQFQHNSSCAKCVAICRFCLDILQRLEASASNSLSMETITIDLKNNRIEEKAGIIMTIPYIFQDKSRIAHFLLQSDYLKGILQHLKKGSCINERIIKVCHVLASHRLAITDPTQVQISELSAAPIRKASAQRNSVTFQLDDGSTLRADRDLLTKRSWYFSVLLQGNFRESKRRKVDLHDTPNGLLKLMLQLLEEPERIDQLVMEHDLEFLFDAIFFMERHGQNDLRSSLVSCIGKHRMNPKTVAAIYRRSIESELNLLRMEAVTFAMVHRCEFGQRVAMFDSLLDMGCTEQLTGDMQTILEESLRPHVRDFEEPDYNIPFDVLRFSAS